MQKGEGSFYHQFVADSRNPLNLLKAELAVTVHSGYPADAARHRFWRDVRRSELEKYSGKVLLENKRLAVIDGAYVLLADDLAFTKVTGRGEGHLIIRYNNEWHSKLIAYYYLGELHVHRADLTIDWGKGRVFTLGYRWP